MRMRPPPGPPPFPYTTLFRSGPAGDALGDAEGGRRNRIVHSTTGRNPAFHTTRHHSYQRIQDAFARGLDASKCILNPRSEEHTSELQSHHDLVCRLLLEKKKN